MSNIKLAFQNGKVLIPLITCGDPSLSVTEKLIVQMDKSGADLILLGMPFSDPMAAGTALQEANERALSNGITTNEIFDMIGRVRKNTRIPIVLDTYANVVFSYGTESFIKKASAIGVDGLILPDIPFEEKDEFAPICRAYGLDLISDITMTSGARIAKIVKEADGFICGISTYEDGAQTATNVMIQKVKEEKALPCVISCGVKTPEEVKKVGKIADGIIIDEAVIELCAQYGKDCISYADAYIKSLKESLENL